MKKNSQFNGVDEFIREFAERVHQIRRKLGYSQTEMSKILGRANNNAVSRIERAATTSISFDLLEGLILMAQDAGVTTEWLFTGLKISPSASVRDIEGALRYAIAFSPTLDFQPAKSTRGDDPKGRPARVQEWHVQKIEAGFRTVAPEDVPSIKDWHTHYVPVIGRIAAGSGVDTDEAAEYPPAWAGEFLIHEGGPATGIAVRVKGKSMEPKYRDGDMVVVDPARPAESGEVCCVIVQVGDLREARLKRLKLTTKNAVLSSLNPDPKYSAERLPRKNLLHAYKIVAHLPLIRRDPPGAPP